MRLAQKIKELRGKEGFSQGLLAQQSGLKRSYISVLESGGILRPSAERLIKLAHALHVEPDVLFQAAGYVSTPIGPINLADPRWNFVLRVLGEQPLEDQQMILEMIMPIIIRKEEERKRHLEQERENRRKRRENDKKAS